MRDIWFYFVRAHRFEMMMRDNPLTQLLQLVGILQHVAKFRLAEQEYLQQRLSTELEI